MAQKKDELEKQLDTLKEKIAVDQQKVAEMEKQLQTHQNDKKSADQELTDAQAKLGQLVVQDKPEQDITDMKINVTAAQGHVDAIQRLLDQLAVEIEKALKQLQEDLKNQAQLQAQLPQPPAQPAQITAEGGEHKFSEREGKTWSLPPDTEKELVKDDVGFKFNKEDNSYEYKDDNVNIVANSKGIFSKNDKITAEGADKMVEAAEKIYKDSDNLVVTANSQAELDLLKERIDNSDVLKGKHVEYRDLSKPPQPKPVAGAKPDEEKEEQKAATSTPSPSPSPRPT